MISYPRNLTDMLPSVVDKTYILSFVKLDGSWPMVSSLFSSFENCSLDLM